MQIPRLEWVITVARRTAAPTGYPWEILQEWGRGAQLPGYRSRFLPLLPLLLILILKFELGAKGKNCLSSNCRITSGSWRQLWSFLQMSREEPAGENRESGWRCTLLWLRLLHLHWEEFRLDSCQVLKIERHSNLLNQSIKLLKLLQVALYNFFYFSSSIKFYDSMINSLIYNIISLSVRTFATAAAHNLTSGE